MSSWFATPILAYNGASLQLNLLSKLFGIDRKFLINYFLFLQDRAVFLMTLSLDVNLLLQFRLLPLTHSLFLLHLLLKYHLHSGLLVGLLLVPAHRASRDTDTPHVGAILKVDVLVFELARCCWHG